MRRRRLSVSDVVRDKVFEHHVLYPDFTERGAEELQMIISVYTDRLMRKGWRAEDISDAFDKHLETSRQFPTLADIIALLTPSLMYRMDHGPLGFGGLYQPWHPYVSEQQRRGVDISKYVVGAVVGSGVEGSASTKRGLRRISLVYDADVLGDASGGSDDAGEG